jgi:cytochrome P450
MDFVSAYVFGLRNSTDFIRQKAYRDHWLQLYLARDGHHFWPQELPRVSAFLRKFGIHLCPRWVDESNRELSEWNMDMCKRTADMVHKEKYQLTDPADEPVVFNALQMGIDKEIAAKDTKSLLYTTTISQREISVASELMDHLLAGQETAGITLTYLAWHLSKSLDLQKKLREELLSISPNMQAKDDKSGELSDPRQLDGLPILHAIVTETLRLHAPIPGPQPRQTPHPACRLGPYEVPGGVRVAALGHSLHRNGDVFPKPEEWDYTRWLDHSDEQRQKEMQRYFWAFGSGGRMCLGSNFAMSGKSSISMPQ